MHQHERAKRGQYGHVGFHLLRIEGWKFVDPRVQQKTLETEHPSIVQGPKLGSIARNRPSPEPDVDECLAVGHRPFQLQSVNSYGGRDAVERHVDDGRDAASGSSAGGGREAFPLGAAGFVHVHVSVDKAGQQCFAVVKFDDFVPRKRISQRFKGHDHAVTHTNLAGLEPRGGHDASAANDQIEVHRRATGVCVVLNHQIPFSA